MLTYSPIQASISPSVTKGARPIRPAWPFRVAEEPIRFLVFEALYLEQADALGGLELVEEILDPALRMFSCVLPEGAAAPSTELRMVRVQALEVGLVFEAERVLVACVERWRSTEGGRG